MPTSRPPSAPRYCCCTAACSTSTSSSTNCYPVRQDDLSGDEVKGLLGAQGSAIIAEKYREAVHGDEMLP